jgi:serine/threonine protein kinase
MTYYFRNEYIPPIPSEQKVTEEVIQETSNAPTSSSPSSIRAVPEWYKFVSDRFQFVKTLSESRDKVYLAKDLEHDNRLVALKLHAGEAKRLLYLQSKGGHENILRLYDTVTIPGNTRGDNNTGGGLGNTGGDNNTLCVLEYASRGDLFDMVDRQRGLSQSRVHNYFCQIVQGLQYVHDHQIAHLDLTCENIFLMPDKKLKIGDFGESLYIEKPGTRIKFPRTLLPGKIHYRCPEMYMENVYLDPYAADVFALGVMLFTMLTGFFPFDTADPARDILYLYISKGLLHKTVCRCKLQNVISDDACDLIQRMLNLEPIRITLPEIQKHKWFVTDPVKAKMMQNMTKNMPQ